MIPVSPREEWEVDPGAFARCAKRGLRRYRQNRQLTDSEELAVWVVFTDSKRTVVDFKSWLALLASPAIDALVDRVAKLPELADLTVRGAQKMREKAERDRG